MMEYRTTEDQEPFLEVRDLSVTYERYGQRVDALQELSFTVEEGEYVIMMGHNGSGKSTALKVLAGYLTPDSGSAHLTSRSIADMSPHERAQHVFLVHQDPLLGTAPTLTVFENLAVADPEANDSWGTVRELEAKYKDLLQPLGLDNRLRQPALTLSGGERQLLALLIARIRPASLVLLDEPTANLDPGRTELCLEEIKTLHTLGKTVLHVTHRSEYAATLGGRTIALREGRIAYDERGVRRSSTEIHNHLHVQ